VKKSLPPALIALFIQCAAFYCTFFLFIAYQYCLSAIIPIWVLVLTQSSLASLMAILLKTAYWWRYIHFSFPVAIGLAISFNISNNFFLVGFILFAVLYWSVFLTQVPYYPLQKGVCESVTKLLPNQERLKVIDIGSGLGGFCMKFVNLRPGSIVHGIEIAPLPWLISYLRGRVAASPAKFTLGNYHQLDFAEFDIVFAYLSPAVTLDLWQKASKEMRPKTLLVSHEFPIPNIQPTQSFGATKHGKITYVYAMR